MGKDIEESIEAETSGDLQTAYLTLGKPKPGVSLLRLGALEPDSETEVWVQEAFIEQFWEQHI